MATRIPNHCAKRVTPEEAYAVYSDGYTTHWVLKKYKNPLEEEKDLYAKWYVASKSPGTLGSYEYGDTYAANIKNSCEKIDNPLASYVCVRLDDQTTFSLTMLLRYRYEVLHVRDVMLVNYMRLAVPKEKLALFIQTAQAHELAIICIDAENEVEQCRNDLHEQMQEK